MKVTSQVLTDVRIDLSPYCRTLFNTSYKLRSIICHIGCASNSGHYVAYIFKEESNSFIRCDDSVIEHALPEETLTSSYVAIYDRCVYECPKVLRSLTLCFSLCTGIRVHIEINKRKRQCALGKFITV